MSQCCNSAPGEVEALEKELRETRARLTRARHAALGQDVPDYELRGTDGRPVRLSELFGGKRDLIVVHSMGARCPNCTLWADGFNGYAPHLRDRAGFAVVSHDAPADQKAFAASRGWTFPLASAAGTTFFEDLGFASPPGWQWGPYRPGVSTFRKREDGGLRRVASAGFGPGDDYCALWHLFDLLEGGAGSWEAKFRYA